MRRYRIINLLLLVFLAQAARAADVEETYPFASIAMPEILLGAGARATAMGGAAAATEDLDALYWNPAGLAGVAHAQAEFMHTTWIQEVSQESLLFSLPLTRGGTAALGLDYFSLGQIERTGITPDGDLQLDGAVLNPYLVAGSVGAGLALWEGVSAGGAVKVLFEDLIDQTYLAITGTLGAQAQILPQLRAGAAVCHAPVLAGRFALPLELRAGVQYAWTIDDRHRVAGALDVELPVQALSQALYHLGAEYRFRDWLFLRLGYQLSDVASQDAGAGFTAGAAVWLSGWQLAYTFAPQGFLGASHRFAIGLDFDAIQEAQAKAEEAKPQPSVRPALTGAGPTDVSVLGLGTVPTVSKPMVAPPVTSHISREEAEMRNLLEDNIQVEYRIRRDRDDVWVEFSFARTSGPKIQTWTFELRDSKGRVIRKVSGEGMVEGLDWDGRDDQGNLVTEEETVSYQVTLNDITGQTERREGQVSLGKTFAKRGQAAPVPFEQQFGGIYFERGRADITPSAASRIAEVAAFILQNPDVKIYIEGYAEPDRETKQAVILSKSRAEAVARYLTAYHKLPLSRILVRGRGTAEPPETQDATRAGNRRLVLITVKGYR